MAKAWKTFLRFWGLVRHVLSVRGLLQWTGKWETVTATLTAAVLAVWSFIGKLPGPVVAIISLAAFVLVSAGWRILRKTDQNLNEPSDAPDNDSRTLGWIVMDMIDANFKPTVSLSSNSGPTKHSFCVSLLVSMTNAFQSSYSVITIASYELIVMLPASPGQIRSIRAEGVFLGDQLDMRALQREHKVFPATKRIERDLHLAKGVGQTRVLTFYLDVEDRDKDTFAEDSQFILMARDTLGGSHSASRNPGRWTSQSSSFGSVVGGM